MINKHWIRQDISFTSYDKKSDDKIVLFNSTEPSDEFLIYSNYYFKAGELITKHLVNDICTQCDISKLDTWFFAVTYLFRQSLELLLKSTLLKYNVNLSDVISDMRHDLAIGIDLLEKHLDDATKTNNNYIWLQEYFKNISEIDKESDMFRYPFNNKMKAFFKEQKHYDYISIYKNVDRARTTLFKLINKSIDTYIPEFNYEPTLLIEGGDYYQQAVIGYKFSQQDFYHYIKAYSESANHLLYLMNTDTKNLDLFLPMCYLFRNSIELELKNIYILHCNLNKLNYDLAKYKHKILKLWITTRPTIDKYSNAPKNDNTLNDCSVYIQKLNNWDGCSSKFRYPINKSGDYFFKRETRYNFRNVANCFNDINRFFSCVHGQLDYYHEIMMDIEKEYRSCIEYDYDYYS